MLDSPFCQPCDTGAMNDYQISISYSYFVPVSDGHSFCLHHNDEFVDVLRQALLVNNEIVLAKAAI
jgi:hypothetical protein